MKISNAFPSRYLRAADLGDRPMLLNMDRVEMENIGDGDDRKPVLYFSNNQKGLCLNKTNSKTISAIYGDDTDHWTGKPIVLFPAMVDFRGDTVEAIRVRKPKPPTPAAKVHTEIDPPPHDDMNDEIGF